MKQVVGKKQRQEQGKSRPKHRRLGWRFYLVCFLALGLAYTAISIYQVQEKEMERLVAEAEELNLRYEAELRKGKQASELNAMVGSAQYIERLARDNLGLVRPDEIIFIQR